jgi:hypothetical protein
VLSGWPNTTGPHPLGTTHVPPLSLDRVEVPRRLLPSSSRPRRAGARPPPLPTTWRLSTPDPLPFFCLFNRTPSHPSPSSPFPLCFSREAAEWTHPRLPFSSHPPSHVQACHCLLRITPTASHPLQSSENSFPRWSLPRSYRFCPLPVRDDPGSLFFRLSFASPLPRDLGVPGTLACQCRPPELHRCLKHRHHHPNPPPHRCHATSVNFYRHNLARLTPRFPWCSSRRCT